MKRTFAREPEGCYYWQPEVETGLLASLETAIASCEPTTAHSLLSSAPHCSRQLLLTLLFLPLGSLRRTHDLRGYTGDALAVVTGRHRVYGYCHTERFLSQLAKANGSEALTTALGSWTAHLWGARSQDTGEQTAPCFYIDGHRKPVYADSLIPRGLIGRSGKILGGRALTLLHDEHGHPRLATTSRGDQHLTIGLPQQGLRQAPMVLIKTGIGSHDLRSKCLPIVSIFISKNEECLTPCPGAGSL